jgi:hypothetical protein
MKFYRQLIKFFLEIFIKNIKFRKIIKYNLFYKLNKIILIEL